MKKIIKYGYVSAPKDGDEFEELVNKAISKGWQPLGGIYVQTIADGRSLHVGIRLYQALVKYEENQDLDFKEQ